MSNVEEKIKRDTKRTDVLDYLHNFVLQEQKNKDNIEVKIKKDNLKILNYQEEINCFHNEKDKGRVFFSPTNVNSERDQEKLYSEIKVLNQELSNNQKLIEEIDTKINAITEIIKYINIESENNSGRKIQFDKKFGLDILEIQEFERKRIARELHDSTVQNLTNLIHKTELCCKLIDLDMVRAKLELQTMIQTIGSTINDMRTIIYDLRPMSIDDLGLVVTVERFIRKMENDNEHLKISFYVENEEIKTLPVVNLTLFRIIQEACNNANTHAKANKITINLIYFKDKVKLIISDNGTGFNKDIMDETTIKELNTCFGLSIMRERIFLLSGTIEFESTENEGTCIKVNVPLQVNMEEENETN